jgi:hypothetical protein
LVNWQNKNPAAHMKNLFAGIINNTGFQDLKYFLCIGQPFEIKLQPGD